MSAFLEKTVRTSAKADQWAPTPNHHQNLIICSLCQYQHFLKFSSKSRALICFGRGLRSLSASSFFFFFFFFFFFWKLQLERAVFGLSVASFILSFLLITTSIFSLTEHRVWKLEPRIQQQYTAYMSILNRNFSTDLSSHTSRAFRKEAKGVQDMVKVIVCLFKTCSSLFSSREGSVVAHFWIVLSVPSSHVQMVTLGKVTESLEEGFRSYRGSEEETANVDGYLLYLPSLSVSDCYRYQKVVSSRAVTLRGPSMQRASCLWHLQATPGSQLELHMEWMLPECRDRLLVYDSLTPSDFHLITSVYGCSKHERVVRILSSGEWMTVVWKKGLYSYEDPFSLSAQAWDHQDCNSTIELKEALGIQGTLRTPFFPSYYPPNTNCTWTFIMPDALMGLCLEFEGYELSRATYNQACTQGQWIKNIFWNKIYHLLNIKTKENQ
uniref:CUB domain-containing protein n=1 Tax=Sphaeramia orbicularis TaxID=375764 RepID=A0A672ZIT4_9TELE